MNLPTSRNTNYTPSTPVLSADLNAIQDCFIGAKHGLLTLKISPLSGQPVSGTGAPGAGSYATAVVGGWKATAAGHTLYVPLPVRAGQTIVNVRARVACGTTDEIQGELWRVISNPGGGPSATQLGSTQTSTLHTSAIETLTFAGINELVGGAFGQNTNYMLTLDALAFGTAPSVYAIELDVQAL